MFQFHTGSIKSENSDSEEEDDSGFNSILVRLKVQALHTEKSLIAAFQFHTGSIKSLKALALGDTNKSVSIPYWFD